MGVSAETNDSMLALNALTYKKPFPLAVASSTQWRVFRALRDGYTPGTTAFIDIAPGASFIDPAVSYLAFEVDVFPTTEEKVETGNFAGVIIGALGETVVRCRNGLEASRSTVHGYGQRFYELYTYATGYPVTVGSVSGSTNPVVYPNGQTTTTDYILPLASVNPFFTTPTLIPSQMGQLRLEITWAPTAEWLEYPAASPPNVVINNLRVVTKTYDLADTALKRLSFIASQTGLVMPYVDRYLTRSEIVGASLNTSSLKAASRGLYAYAIPGTARDNPENASNMNGVPWNDNDRFQFSLGSQFVTAEPVATAVDALVQANHAFGLWGRAKDNVSNQVSIDLFTGGPARAYALMACNLERSHVLAYNGMAVSSSRPLLIQGTTVNGERLYFYLCYLRLLYVFSDSNVSIKE